MSVAHRPSKPAFDPRDAAAKFAPAVEGPGHYFGFTHRDAETQDP